MSPVMSLKNAASTMVRLAHADDLRLAVPLAAYLFVVMTSSVIGKAVRDGLFLTRFTALQMTYADLQTVIAIAVTMGVYFRLQRSLRFERLLMASSVLFVAADVACWWAASFHQPWLTRAIYLCVGTQAALMPPQVSILARQVLTTRQAKRLLGLIGCGAIFGWIVGGLVTRAAAGRTGAESLLLVMGGLSAMCPMLILGIGRARKPAPPLRPDDPSTPGLFRSATLVWSSSHLRTVASLVFLSSVVTTIAGLQFRAIASQSIGATDQLTAFFGSFSFHAGLLSLAIQILLTSRVLRSFGVGAALVIAPVAIATGSVGVLIWGTLSTAVFLKGSDHVLRHSIDRAALELLYVPLSASEALQAKTFIEAVVYRLGDGAGTLAVIFGASMLHMSFPCLSVISLALLCAWIAVAMQAQHGYLDHLLAALRRSCLAAGPARPFTPTVRRREPPATWPNVLCAGNNDQELTAAGRAATAHLRQALHDASLPPDVRRRNAHILSHSGSLEAGRALADSVLEPDQTLRLEILRALTAWHACHPGEVAGAEPVNTALAAEIVGLYCLCQTRDPDCSDAAAAAARESEEALERILRLLNLICPSLDLASAFAAFQSNDARLRANALEYLENILEPHYRKVLVPLLERGEPGPPWRSLAAAGEIRPLSPASLDVIERFLRRSSCRAASH
jgi:ATP/ADP translocase